jgi:energy-coupling factor transporter ATP-binding protein EcfA2
MAHIVKFKIEGLAGRVEPYSASLNRDFNVFFGPNGSGKTTLLKILQSALSTDTEILKDLPFKHAEVEIYINQAERSFIRSFSQQDPGDASKFLTYIDASNFSAGVNDALKNYEGTIGALTFHASDLARSNFGLVKAAAWTISSPEEPNSRALVPVAGGFLPISRLYRNLETPAGLRRLSEKELDSAFARGLQSQWTAYYADISQEVTRVQERGFANILGFFLSGMVSKGDQSEAPGAEEAYTRIRNFLSRQPASSRILRGKNAFVKVYAEKPELRHVVKQIEKVENEIAQVSAPRERFRSVLESMFTGSKHLIFTEKEIKVELADKKEIGLTSLSSGEKQLLFIALHALIGGSNPLIVDEPELSMHVDWQRKLLSILSDLNPKMQQIMATHSPEIMADLPDDKIFRL